MSRASALVISSSSAFSGSAPGCAYNTMLSRMIIRVGMEVMLKVAATSGCASVSTLPNTASGCFSDDFSKTGPNIRHGGHHSAQKSTRTRPFPVTVELKFSAVSSTVAIVCLLAVNTRRGIDNDARPKIPSGQRPEQSHANARNSCSSQRQEQLLEPRAFRGRLAAARLLVEYALAEPAGDDLEPGPVQGARRRRQLRQHVRTLLAVLDHPDHAADLALRPAQPPDHVRELLAVHVHGGHVIPLGVCARRVHQRKLDSRRTR